MVEGIKYPIIENSKTVGLVAYHNDLTLLSTTIEGSGQSGLWLTDATASKFDDIRIEGNATVSTLRGGVEVNEGGAFTSHALSTSLIANNTYHEVSVGFGASAVILGLYGSFFSNAIRDPSDDTNEEKYIYNSSGSTVYAETVYWNPSATLLDFAGPVAYLPTAPSDLTSMAGADESSIPLRYVGADDDTRVPGSVSASVEVAAVTYGQTQPDNLAIVHSRMQQLRDQISSRPYDTDNAQRLRDLYALEFLDLEDRLKERAQNASVIAAARQRLVTRNLEGLNASDREAVQLAGEAALLIEIKELLRRALYDSAADLISRFGSHVQDSDHRRELLLSEVMVLEQAGRYADALETLEAYKRIEPKAGGEPGYVPEDYNIVEQSLREGLTASKTSAKVPAGETSGRQHIASVSLPLGGGTTLGTGYPNPFNPTTVIPFALTYGAQVKIEVYDLTGRRVAVLADQYYGAGSYEVNFGADNLASGIYIVRAHVSSEGHPTEMLTRKVILMK